MSAKARILTTHVGSLPRPQAVAEQVVALENGEAIDAAVFDTVMACPQGVIQFQC